MGRFGKLDARKVLVLLPAALLTAGLSYSLSSPTSGSLIAAALADPLSVFADRSPGTRTSAALNQTKKARAQDKDGSRAVAAVLPSERVLTNVRTRPPVAAAPDAPQYTDALLTTPLATDVAAILPDIGILPPVSVAPTGIGSIPGFVPGGVGFLPGGGGGGVTPVEPGAPGVPEPSTWLMLILGFLAIGWTLRSKPRGFFGERERVSG